MTKEVHVNGCDESEGAWANEHGDEHCGDDGHNEYRERKRVHWD